MKTFFKLLVLLGVVAYLFYVFADISGKRDSTRCKEVNVIIVDSSYAGFINADEVVRILKKEKIYPVGQLMEEVNGDSLEKALEKNSFVSIVKCYKTPGGRVNINISQRLPILRIKADNGDDYYIDNKGVAMMPENYTADVAVAMLPRTWSTWLAISTPATLPTTSWSKSTWRPTAGWRSSRASAAR